MKFRRLAILLLCAFVLRAAALAAEPFSNIGSDAAETADFDGYLVRLEDSATATVAAEGEIAESELEPVVGNLYLTYDEALAEELLESGAAEYVEPNYRVTLIEPEDGVESDVSLADDSDDSDGWAYSAVYADYAASLGLDGTGVRVAVIDSGVDLENADLTAAKIAKGYDYILNTTEMTDNKGHGTMVTQVIAGDDNDLGGTGIARGVTIVPLRCFAENVDTYASTLAKAVSDAVDVYDCDVINMSWGLSSNSAALYEAIQYAASQGVILVAASGNTSSYTQGTLVYPAAYDEVISVGAVNSSLTIGSFSIRNAGLTVCAPGVSIPIVKLDGTDTTINGTSFASPCVAAEIALLLQFAPNLTSDDLFSLLAERALDLGSSGWDRIYGYGFARLDRLLAEQWSTYDADSGTFSASLLCGTAGSSLLLAAYSDAGRLLSLECLTEAAAGRYAAGSADLSSLTDAATLALFYLSDSYSPLSSCGRWTLGE